MNKLCEVGVITKPQGLKGHFRVRLNYSNFSMLSELKEVVIENNKYEIEKITHRDGFEIFKVKGIDNIDVVENLRNKIIYAEISERKTLAKDEFYIRDLIGSNVFVDKDKIGKIENILTYGSADIFVVKKDNKETLIPFVKGLVKNFNLTEKKLVLNKEKFNEIVESEQE